MKKAMISGITGQDGSYLAESLVASGYEVHGLVRQSSLLQRTRLDELATLPAARAEGRLQLHYADLSDSSSLQNIVRELSPDYLCHLAGQSHIGISFRLPEYTANTTGLGTLRLLEAVRQSAPKCWFFLAATSEIFGAPLEMPQTQNTPLAPVNPYAAAKVYALNLLRIYRKSYGLFACAGILFNHESPRRDWGYAVDTVRGMRAIAESDQPDDFVIATGVSHSVADFCQLAFERVGLDYRDYVVSDPRFIRPIDIPETRGDATKARERLGWVPQTGFAQLVTLMVDAELQT